MYRGIDRRVIFMGTPDFAVPTLRTLVEHAPPGLLLAGGLDVVAVVTQPDKPAGRGNRQQMSPVKQFATEHGLTVYQPTTLRDRDVIRHLRVLAPDVIVVAAFGMILPQEVLNIPQYGCLNVHASLLPKYRGASPIAGALLNGESETGVTIMLMDAGLDTGPILARQALAIEPGENAGELTMRLAVLGATLLANTLPLWLARGIAPEVQNNAEATMTRPIPKGAGLLDWQKPAMTLERIVQAYTPSPGAYTTWEEKRVKILSAHALDAAADVPPGTCFLTDERGVQVLACACDQSSLVLEMIQLEGKRALPADEVLRGHPQLATAVFGTSAPMPGADLSQSTPKSANPASPPTDRPEATPDASVD